MLVNLLSNVSYYIPEILVIATMCGLLLLECAYSEKEGNRTLIYVSGIIGLALTILTLIFNLKVNGITLFAKAVVVDSFTTFMKITMTLGTAGCFYIAAKSQDIYTELKTEYMVMALGVLVGGMLLASSNNLLTLYLGLETVSILSYVMTAMKRKDSHSTEAGIKYALYGGVTAGIMLFGMSHIYGIFGSIQFENIIAGLQNLDDSQTVVAGISFLLFFVGIGYKIACFPFHMWSPDVYEGSPIPVTSFFSIVPKLAGIAIVSRVTILFFSNDSSLAPAWIGMIQIIAALTMTVGNVSALNQSSVKRMLAFSSIGHVGMILMGVLVMNVAGQNAILFYGFIYTLMTLGAFYVTMLVSNKHGSDDMIFFKGLFKTYPILGICFSIILFSLAGLPPFGGFIAKFNMISVAVGKGYIGLSIIAAINSVISLYYYLKLVRYMTLEDAEDSEELESFSLSGAVYILAVTIPVVFLGLFWNKIYTIYSAIEVAAN